MAAGTGKDDAQARAAWFAQERAHLIALGAFIAQFSQLEFTAKARTAWVFQRYHGQVSVLIDNVETVKVIDALPRLARLRGIKGAALAEIDDACSEFMAINLQRVTAAHGLWDVPFGVGRRPARKGATEREWSLATAELHKLTDRCQALMQRFLVLPLGPRRRRRNAIRKATKRAGA